MADVFSSEKRSDVMSRIKSKNTKPEILLRKFLFSKGFRYRLHKKNLPGKPDIVLKKYNTVILVNGCFWHGHESETCKIARRPKSNVDYWDNKITENQQKDTRNQQLLAKLGWHIIVVWECELRGKNAEKTCNAILEHFTPMPHL